MDVRRLMAKVTLKSPPTGQDTLGQPTGSWSDVATVFADIRHESGLEAIKAGAETSAVRCSVRVNYRASILPSWRVVFGAKTYEVKAVLPDSRKRWVDLACELVTA